MPRRVCLHRPPPRSRLCEEPGSCAGSRSFARTAPWSVAIHTGESRKRNSGLIHSLTDARTETPHRYNHAACTTPFKLQTSNFKLPRRRSKRQPFSVFELRIGARLGVCKPPFLTFHFSLTRPRKENALQCDRGQHSGPSLHWSSFRPISFGGAPSFFNPRVLSSRRGNLESVPWRISTCLHANRAILDL